MAKSEYLKREEAAKKQLGAKGVKKRVKQLPTAARAFTREMTGIDVSRKGVKVDPFSVAMALPVGKVLKAANVLRAAGKVGKANALEARLVAKNLGKLSGREIARTGEAYPTAMVGNMKAAAAAKETASSVFPRSPKKGSLGDLEYLPGMTKTQAAVKMRGQTKRAAYRKSIEGTRVTELEKRLNLPGKAPSRSNVSEGTLNIVDTRRMNPAQAKSALEGGVNQTAVFKRRGPSAPKKVNKVTKRLLGGR